MKFFTQIKVIDEDANPVFAEHFDAWRWEIEIKGLGVWVCRQARTKTGKWRFGYGYYIVHWRWNPKDWKFAREHAYYDGPHDHLALGPIYANWQGAWCDKCYDGDE